MFVHYKYLERVSLIRSLDNTLLASIEASLGVPLKITSVIYSHLRYPCQQNHPTGSPFLMTRGPIDYRTHDFMTSFQKFLYIYGRLNIVCKIAERSSQGEVCSRLTHWWKEYIAV